MAEMKDSGIEWIGECPVCWQFLKGKYIFSLRNDKGNTVELQLLSPTQKFGVIPQFLFEKLTTNTTVKVKENTDLSQFKTIHKGDFCISLRSFQGGFEYCTYEGVVSPAYQVFYPIIKICDNYYKYLFKDQSFISKMNSYTLSLRDGKNIAFVDFGNTYLPIPPLSEQEKIATFLDVKCKEIDALFTDIHSEIDLLEEYKRSVITEKVTKGLKPNVEMKDSGIEWVKKIPMTWGKARIGYNSWIRARLGWKGLKAEEYVDEGYAFLSAFNIINNRLDWNNLNYITQERYDESPEIKLRIGDIILVKDGAGIGKCAKIDVLPVGEATTNGSLAVISTYANLDYRYLYYYLQSSMFQNYIFRIMNGMGVPHLPQEELRKITVPVPPIEEQNDIADYLEKKCAEINEALNEKKQQLDILEQYKKSMIYEYVTGKKEVV